MSRRNEKMQSIRFELVALRQWAKISVQRSLPLGSLKALLASKFDCDFDHMPMKASIVEHRQGKNHKRQISTALPIQDIPYFKEPLQEHRVIIELDYWGG